MATNVQGGDAGCCTGKGITGQAGRTGQCRLFGQLFHFRGNILLPHPVYTHRQSRENGRRRKGPGADGCQLILWREGRAFHVKTHFHTIMTDGPTDGGTGGQATNLPTRGVMIPALDPDRESDFGWKFVIPILFRLRLFSSTIAGLCWSLILIPEPIPQKIGIITILHPSKQVEPRPLKLCLLPHLLYPVRPAPLPVCLSARVIPTGKPSTIVE